jgi:uncharacterized protein (DUF1697 family)
MVGRQGLTKAVLLELAEDAGGRQPRSYLATGNLSFYLAPPDVARFKEGIEQRIAGVIGRYEPVFIRSVSALQTLAEIEPFAAYPKEEIYERCVTFLERTAQWEGSLLQTTARGDVTLIAATPTEIFSVTRLVKGTPGTAGPIVESKFQQKVTTRNWNTIERILKNPL